MNMLEVLKERLPEGLTVVSLKETSAKYKITFDYNGTTDTAELPKSCAPGCHEAVADNTVKTVMSSVMMKMGDIKAARKWLCYGRDGRKERTLKDRLEEWSNKVLAAYEARGGEMADTFQMIADVDRIIAEEFEREPVLGQDDA